MLGSIRTVKRWVAEQLKETEEYVFERPPADMVEFAERRGRWLVLRELKDQLTENEDAD